MRVTVCLFLISLAFPFNLDAKKIKNSFKIEKETKGTRFDSNLINLEDDEINLTDSVILRDSGLTDVIEELLKCKFAGYDKELNSNIESFIIVNSGGRWIKGFKIRIDYLDMTDRMLHSRVISQSVEVPPGESRRVDLKSWDSQHTYYYYLGNEPRRVASPFKVAISPLSFWIAKE